jgi:hypothetical protein
MPWYVYLLELLAGALLANGVPHFVQGVSGAPFQSPFAKPPGIGESSPLSNVLWGLANLLAGALLLHCYWPAGTAGWTALGAGILLLSVQLSLHFGKVRNKAS